MLNKTNKKMKKVRAAIVGYGNIGRYVLEALQAAPDFEIAGVVRRAGAENKPAELNDYAVVKDIKELQGVDVAILCTPTRSVEKYAKEILAMGINTVDSFDIHTGIVDLRRELGACAKEHGAVSIGRMGSGKRLDRTHHARSNRPQRNHLHQLRSGYEYGPYGSRQSYRWSESGFIDDYPYRNRHSSPYGIHRTERRI